MNTKLKGIFALFVLLAFGPMYPPEYLAEITAGDNELYRMASAIIISESGWKPGIKNKMSSASGLFQFLDSTFTTFCIEKYSIVNNIALKNDPAVQLDCGVNMLREGLSSHWNESKKYWHRFAVEE